MSGCDYQNPRFSVPVNAGDNYDKIDWGKKKKKKKIKKGK
jgi:hypothetical protein